MKASVEQTLRELLDQSTPSEADRRGAEDALRAVTTALLDAGWPLAGVLPGGATVRGTDIANPLRSKSFLIINRGSQGSPATEHRGSQGSPATDAEPAANTPAALLASLHAVLLTRPEGQGLPPLDPFARAIEFTAAPGIELALVPALRGHLEIQRNGRPESVPCLWIPASGSWRATALPDTKRALCDRADQQAGGALRPLIRLLKRWNRDHGAALHPLHLEVLSYSAFLAPPPDMLTGLSALLLHLAGAVLEPCPDPTGIGPRLDAGLPVERLKHLSLMLRGAAAQLTQAGESLLEGYHSEAHRAVQAVFGAAYPLRNTESLRTVVICLDVYGALAEEEVMRAAGPSVHPPVMVREAPERPLLPATLSPQDWEPLGRLVTRLAARVRALRQPDGPPLRLFLCGLAPLPLFVQLGMELSSWLGEQTFLNRRPDGRWDRLPLQPTAASSDAAFFDVVRGLQRLEPSGSRGLVALFIAPANYTTPVAAVEDFFAAHSEDLAGLVEVRSERAAFLSEDNAAAAAAELLLACRQLRAAYPVASGVALFVAGPASLAYIAGRAINPNVMGSVLVANFKAPAYALALRLPLLGGSTSARPARLRVRSLTLMNYRGVGTQRFDFDEALTVLVGINGSGKTSVLWALALLLGQLGDELRDQNGPTRLDRADIAMGKGAAKCEISASLDDAELTWSQECKGSAPSAQRLRFQGESRRQLELLRQEAKENASASLPLVVYYSVQRGDIEIPERLRKRSEHDRLALMYDRGVLKGAADFRSFFEWFKECEDAENAEKNGNVAYQSRPLAAVRRAIERLLPGFHSPRIRRSPLRLVVRKGQVELAISQLSDGERSLLALAGDLAQRLTEAHPSLVDPLAGAGVVLIDEIELHLHPGWQQRVVGDLSRVFPGCQFIVTTHSPHVLSTVAAASIRVLAAQADEGPALTPGWQTRGAESSAVLAAIMGVDPVPDVAEARWLSQYRGLIQEGLGESEEALGLRARLDAHFGKSHPLMQDCDRLLRFAALRRKREGGAAGSGGA